MKGAESTEELHFFCEGQSVPTFADYNGTKCRYIHPPHGDIVGIVDAAGNLVVVYRYDKRGVYSMQMNDIMKSLCEESAYVSVYGDPMEVAKFKFGKFLCVGDFRTVMLLERVHTIDNKEISGIMETCR